MDVQALLIGTPCPFTNAGLGRVNCDVRIEYTLPPFGCPTINFDPSGENPAERILELSVFPT
jgi:hypothetical protein